MTKNNHVAIVKMICIFSWVGHQVCTINSVFLQAADAAQRKQFPKSPDDCQPRSVGRQQFSVPEAVCAFKDTAVQKIKKRMEDKCLSQKI